MKALTLLRTVRFKEQDNDEIKYSDYDIIGALNEVLRYINIDLAKKGSEYLHKLATFNQNEINAAIEAENEANVETPEYEAKSLVYFSTTGMEFPESFISLLYVQRSDGYRLHPVSNLMDLQGPWGDDKYFVAGGKIYVKHDQFTLGYMGGVEPIKDIETDVIDLPDIFFDVIIKLTRLVLNNGDVDTMTQAVTSAVNDVIPRRRYSNARQRMPFYL